MKYRTLNIYITVKARTMCYKVMRYQAKQGIGRWNVMGYYIFMNLDQLLFLRELNIIL